MGGIGKTQLVVEYVHRYRNHYPDGVFWIEAAGPLVEGFARLATDPRLRWAEADRPRDEQIRAAFTALGRRPRGLLVLDNLPDPAAIAVPLLADCIPEALRCRLLFTTRRHDLGRFAGVEVTILPESAALQLLLRHSSRRAALDPDDPDHEHARAIVRMLGRLPLALELAGAYLGKYAGDITLESYRSGLRADGALATLDADAAELTEADLRRIHTPAVAATIREQWEALGDESARWLLRVASLFPESSAVPIARLGLLADLADKAPPGRLSPLRRAVKRLEVACMAERLEADRLRLHPLIREFADEQTPTERLEEFRHRCMERATTALESLSTLEDLDLRRGLDGLQEDLIAILELCPSSAPDIAVRLQALLRLFQREAHNLRVGDREWRPLLFAQQIRNRAFLLGIGRLQSTAEQRLSELGRPHFWLRWTASRESPALVRTFVGHHDWVDAVAVTPDGRCALSGSDDCTVKLWDLSTGQPRLTLTGHTGPVHALAILRDGCRAWSGSLDGTLRLWDLATGQVCVVLADQGGPVYALVVTPDERYALSACNDNNLRVWDLQTRQRCAILTCPEGPVHALSVTPDGSLALSGSTDGHICVWDIQTGRLRQRLVAHDAPVYALGMMPDGRRVLSSSLDGTLKLWDPHRGQLLAAFPGHRDDVHGVGAPVYAVAITPDGRRAISGSGDSTLRLWDLGTAQLCQDLVGHERGVTSVAVTPDGRYALSGSTDDTLKLWDLEARPSFPTSAGHQKGVTAVVVTRDGRQALSGSRDSTMRLWDLGSPEPSPTVTRHEDWVSALAVTPDGLCAISGCEDCILRLWDLGTGRLRSSMIGHEGGVTAVAVTADGRHAVSGSRDGTLKLWDLSTDQPLRSFSVSGSFVTAVAITPDGRQAVAGFFDGTLNLWDVQTGELLRTLSGSGSHGSAVAIVLDGRTVTPDWSQVRHSRVSALAITPDGMKAVSGSRGKTGEIDLWDLRSGALCNTLAGHEDDVTALAVAPDGRHMLSASRDRTLKLWDLAGRACRATFLLDSAPVAIALAPDGRSVVVGDRIGNVHYVEVHVDSGAVGLSRAEAVLPHGQTSRERGGD
jgi:WD40 repeat protein